MRRSDESPANKAKDGNEKGEEDQEEEREKEDPRKNDENGEDDPPAFSRTASIRQSRQSMHSICVSTKSDLTPGERHLLGGGGGGGSGGGGGRGGGSAASGVSRETWEILLAQANQAHEANDRNLEATRERISRASSASTGRGRHLDEDDDDDTKQLVHDRRHHHHHHHRHHNNAILVQPNDGEDRTDSPDEKRKTKSTTCCGIDKLRLVQLALFLLCFVIILVIILIILLYAVHLEQEKSKTASQDEMMALLTALTADVALLKAGGGVVGGGGGEGVMGVGFCGDSDVCGATSRWTVTMAEIQENSLDLDQTLRDSDNLTRIKEEARAFKEMAVEAWLFATKRNSNYSGTSNNNNNNNNSSSNSSCVPQYMDNFIVYVKTMLDEVVRNVGEPTVAADGELEGESGEDEEGGSARCFEVRRRETQESTSAKRLRHQQH